MPVTGLYFLPETAGQPPTLSLFLDALHRHHAPLPSGRYTFEHRLLRSTLPAPTSAPPSAPTTSSAPSGLSAPSSTTLQLLEIPHLSRHPLLHTSNTTAAVDREFTAFLRAKLGGLWTHKQTLRCEGQGFEIEGADLRVRVGRLVMGETVRGTVVEVEMGGVERMGEAEGVLRGFLEGVVGGEGETLGGKGRWVLGEAEGEGGVWGVLDTGRQYCELLRPR
ncbi:mediator complex, subunit Med20 [Geopyxis carbonaria]|nr:mediator complex, subunit Med20 [Geopyxis carbonaria]